MKSNSRRPAAAAASVECILVGDDVIALGPFGGGGGGRAIGESSGMCWRYLRPSAVARCPRDLRVRRGAMRFRRPALAKLPHSIYFHPQFPRCAGAAVICRKGPAAAAKEKRP